MTPQQQLRTIVPTVCDLVDRIDPMALNDPTPCERFTVHDVLDHMIVLGTRFAHGFRGEDIPDVAAPPVYGRVPAREFRAAMEELLAAVESPGAMERTLASPVGPLPGSTFARLVAFDGLVHGWDLAVATGQGFEVPSDVVAEIDGFARAALTDDLRDGDTFKQPNPAPQGATPIEQIAAFSGRTV
jgi:uncharacterized protein (TIGR03086 family)